MAASIEDCWLSSTIGWFCSAAQAASVNKSTLIAIRRGMTTSLALCIPTTALGRIQIGYTNYDGIFQINTFYIVNAFFLMRFLCVCFTAGAALP
jgi:hypothetical protein